MCRRTEASFRTGERDRTEIDCQGTGKTKEEKNSAFHYRGICPADHDRCIIWGYEGRKGR